MSFLNPLSLWGPLALAAVALPILIHLLSRFRPKPMEWAAMELLRRALVVRARRVRLEDILLLILRAAALAAVAFALARPALTESQSSWVGNSRVGVVVAIDGSYSMAHQAGVTKSRMEHALARAREVFGTLATGDPVSLVLLGQRPRVVLRNIAYDRDRVENVLKSLEPLAESLNVELSLEELTRLQAELTAPAKECYLITDAQVTSWNVLSESAASALNKLRQESTVYFVPVGLPNAENVAVTRLAVSSGVLRKGGIACFQADVRNFGRLEARNLNVKLLVEGVEADKTLIEALNPGESRSLSFFAPFSRSGVFTVSAALEGHDSLAADNERFLVANVRESVNVLCVDGSPSTERLGGETGVLALALAPRRSGVADAQSPGHVAVRIAPSDAFGAADLSGQDIVCLAGVGELTRPQVVGLGEYVNRGGGLVVFLGRKSDRNALNGMRDKDGAPLLPAEIGELVGEQPRDGEAGGDSKAWNLAPEPAEHPVTNILSRTPVEQWLGVRFWRYAKVSPRDGARVLLKLTPGGDPLLVEQRRGRGKVYLFTTSANRDWNDLIVNPAYLSMIQLIVTDLTRRPYETPALVGEKLTFDVTPDDVRRELIVRDPLGENLQARVVEQDGLRSASLERAERAGVYSLKVGDRPATSGAEQPREARYAVNVNTQESDVAVMRDADLTQFAQRQSLRLIGEKQTVLAAVAESRQGRELWRILLVIALSLFVIEAVLARLFTRRVQEPVEVYSRRAAAL